ncbi:hypothetical protein DAMA08_032940 [Martiniozyma asiatica (nom. inval.)]|nr:hypothetical protein DAMA08_032940 [Martiniozyma asiatica]
MDFLPKVEIPPTASLLLIGPTQKVFNEFLDFLSKFGLYQTDSDNTGYPPIEKDLINYTFLSTNGNDQNFNSIGSDIGIYTIASPLPESYHFKRLIDCITNKDNIQVLYLIDCERWNPVTSNSTKEEVFANVKNIFGPLYSTINDRVWSKIGFVLWNVSIWNYDVYTMNNIDFVQQLLRSMLVNKGWLLYKSNDIDWGQIISALRKNGLPLDIHNLGQLDMISQLKPVDEVSDSDFIFNSYSDLQVWNDEIDKINLIDESFQWSHWQKGLMEVEHTEKKIRRIKQLVNFKQLYSSKVEESLQNYI